MFSVSKKSALELILKCKKVVFGDGNVTNELQQLPLQQYFERTNHPITRFWNRYFYQAAKVVHCFVIS